MNTRISTVIEPRVKDYKAARDTLAMRVRNLEDAIQALTRKLLPGIKSAAAQAKAARQELAETIALNEDLFKRPRTIILHGIKVGAQKGKGTVAWSNADQVVRLIEKHFADQADALIVVTKKPAKAALANLSVAELKRIGCTIKGAGDQVVIKDALSNIDKLVDKLLSEAPEDLEDVA